MEGTVVYEVIRIVKGVPLFFTDHYHRLLHSCSLIGYVPSVDPLVLLREFRDLTEKNRIREGNILMKIAFTGADEKQVIAFIPHHYPTDDEYRKGVRVDFLPAQRNNPEAKVEQNVRERANQMLQSTDGYEVLLVDPDGGITEGSRSNVFFLRNNRLVTAPLNRVLKGITMAKVLEIAETEHIPVVFSAVKIDDLGRFSSAFLTGTSPRILPIATAGPYSFSVDHPVVETIRKRYDEMMEQDIQRQLYPPS